MLAGMQDDFGVGRSMFDTLGATPPGRMAPSPGEMAARMQQLQVNRRVEFTGVRVQTYDLGDDRQREQYQLDLEHLMVGMELQTHMLLWRPPPQFVTTDGAPRYIAHLEWAEFKLCEKPAAVTGQR